MTTLGEMGFPRKFLVSEEDYNYLISHEDIDYASGNYYTSSIIDYRYLFQPRKAF